MIGSCAELRPQLAAQLEAAFDLGAEIDVDDHEVRKPVLEPGERFLAAAVAGDAIALAAQAREIVVADRDVVLDDGDELAVDIGACLQTGLDEVGHIAALPESRGARGGRRCVLRFQAPSHVSFRIGLGIIPPPFVTCQGGSFMKIQEPVEGRCRRARDRRALVSACTTLDPYTRERSAAQAQRQAVIGAAAGAVVGLITGDSSMERKKRALVGAGLGALGRRAASAPTWTGRRRS